VYSKSDQHVKMKVSIKHTILLLLVTSAI